MNAAAPSFVKDHSALITALRDAIGADAVLVDSGERRFYSQDVYSSGVMPLAAVRPTSVAAVQRAVEVCAAAGVAMVPRGGGMSYTSGYLPISKDSVSFDLAAIDAIIEIRPDDMVVTVEAGCTWKALRAALAPHGLRTPYWGPISGSFATVGGAMSQNSVFWGAVQGGTAAQHVLGFDVVLADGSLLSTGARGGLVGSPAFYRHYGPELTGLFTGDCGAMGFKVRITLPLIDLPKASGAASYGFDTADQLIAAVSELSRRQLISECAMFDQGQQTARVTDAKMPLRQMAGTFLAVLRKDGPRAALSMAMAGQRFLAEVATSAHLIFEAPSKSELERRMTAAQAIAQTNGGWAIEPTIARALSADPFPPVDGMLGPSRFVPVHGMVPHSLAPEVYARLQAIFARDAAETVKCKVRTGIFSVPVGNSMILIEPTWHWDSPFLEAHPRLFGRSADKMAGIAANPEGEALVARLRDEVTWMFNDAGAASFQIGKHYPFQASRQPVNMGLIAAFKAQVDPHCLMNPGALGFGGAQ